MGTDPRITLEIYTHVASGAQREAVEVLVWTFDRDVCNAILVRSGGKCQTQAMAKLEIDINKLTPEERLDLIEELWDSLSADPAKYR